MLAVPLLVGVAGPVAPPDNICVAEARVNPVGKVSLISTFVASSVPVFLTKIVYFACSPDLREGVVVSLSIFNIGFDTKGVMLT